MTGTEVGSQSGSGGTPTVSTRRRYRRLLFGSVGVGVIANVALRLLSYPVAAEAAYWVGILGFLAVWQFSPVTLFDERDAELERRASTVTLVVAAVVLVLGASGARTLSALNLYDAPPFLSGVLYGYVGLFVVFAVAYGWMSRTR
ncbi:DUF2178 domain-containing protein [Halobaculum magnesiiphilum]|uniref:DUF2178 domain-containing protein n=1 Tax=Halobaculum magnesiiphilum TaxID=1017351 RepID=A0A8T8WG21_9EURY|nr:DUF2178 domain-containing protein [Halobaculum magnesiiphilum]QZP38809.1 DUF2178 domain-containing protein [Halobaculum magnesiiphilum]